MERLHYRSTSLTDIQAELHQHDLLREAESRVLIVRTPRRPRAFPFGLRLFRRQTSP